jgi:hypothetical protein
MAEFGREQGEKQRKWCHGLAAYPMGWKGVYGEPSAAALSSQLGQNSSKEEIPTPYLGVPPYSDLHLK